MSDERSDLAEEEVKEDLTYIRESLDYGEYMNRRLPNTARESRPFREAGAFRPQSEPDAEQGGRESRALH